MYLKISSLNNSAKISCNLQLVTLNISVKWCISTVLFRIKIYQGKRCAMKGIPFLYENAPASSYIYDTLNC